MPSLLPLFIFLLPYLVHALPEHYTTTSRDVVVIGGGASGTYAAVNLKARGNTVAIVEQQGRLGGHVETYRDPATGETINVGVMAYYNNTVNNAYFSLLGVPMALSAPFNIPSTYRDFNTGKPVPGYEPAAFPPAAEVYMAYISKTYPYLSVSHENLTYPIPDELLEPFTVFVARHNFTDMLCIFDQTVQNIGNPWQLPTYHAIHALDSKFLTAYFNGLINALSGDNQDIYNAAARFLRQENVFLDAKVTAMDRSGRCFGAAAPSPVCVLVLSTPTGASTLIKARKLLVATPPTLHSLAPAALDLDAHERSLFSHFHGFPYWAFVLDTPHLNASVPRYINTGAHTPYNLPSLPGVFSIESHTMGNKTKYVGWFGAVEASGWTRDRVQDTVASQVARIGGGNTRDVIFELIKEHTPFRLHVSPKAVANGFYRDLYALQGRQNTFWTGAAWAEQDSSLIWMWSEESLLPKMEAALAS